MMAFMHLLNTCLGSDTKKHSLNSSDFRGLEILRKLIVVILKVLMLKNTAYDNLT